MASPRCRRTISRGVRVGFLVRATARPAVRDRETCASVETIRCSPLRAPAGGREQRVINNYAKGTQASASLTLSLYRAGSALHGAGAALRPKR